MNRIILAFLALFAGLAAQAGPAEARIGAAGDTEIRALALVRGASRDAARETQMPVLSAPSGEGGISAAAPVAAFSACPPVRAVLFGIDRAFE